jgi:VanZ family protein
VLLDGNDADWVSMHSSRWNRNLAIAAAIIVTVIIYGSLYPFTFRVPAFGLGPVHKLLESWAEPPGRGDFLANIMFYLPFGFFARLAIARNCRMFQTVLFIAISGALLSSAMELAQYYVQSRVTAANDVYANVIGTSLGAIIGSLGYGNVRLPLFGEISCHSVPCLLLAFWVGYRLFPYIPTIDLHKYWDAIKPVVLHPRFTSSDLFRYTVTWLTIGALIEAIAGPRRAWLLFPMFIASVLLAKVLIVSKTLSAAEVVGAGSAVVAWFVLAVGVGERFRVASIALLLSTSVILERLAPFQFNVHARHFGWVPFLGFMYGALEVNVMSFFEKAFLYGSLIWLIGRAGIRYSTAAVLVAAMIFCTSWVETYLPNRSAEITDALMTLLIGTIIALMEGGRKTGPVSETP